MIENKQKKKKTQPVKPQHGIALTASSLASLTSPRGIAGGDGIGAPSRRLHGDLRQDSAREEREVGVREEDNTSQLRLEWGGARG